MKGHTWARRAMTAGWNLIMAIWQFRNETLQKPDNLETLEGKEILDHTIKKEWQVGLSKLPALEFSQYFRIKEQTLLHKTLQYKKDWLQTVKLARALYEDATEEDEFDVNPALREWIGLPKLQSKRNT